MSDRPRRDTEEREKEEDSLGLVSGADQGPWISVASASTVISQRWPTPTRRISRATGKLWGYVPGGREKRKRKRRKLKGALASPPASYDGPYEVRSQP